MSFATHAASCPLAPPYGFSRYQYAPQAPKETVGNRGTEAGAGRGGWKECEEMGG